jgi:rubrerythrin
LNNTIPTHYDIAIANILDCNCILADFIGEKSEDIKFCFYLRDANSETIYRVVQTLKQIRRGNKNYQFSLFENELNFLYADKIVYTN